MTPLSPNHSGSAVTPERESAASVRETLEQARKLESLNRRMERYLSIQLQQLELAIASFEREQAHWNRQYRQELEYLEQRKAELGEGSHPVRPRPPAGGLGTKDPRVAESPSNRRSFWSTPHASTGGGPLKIWLQPNGAGLQWLGALLLEVAKLNCTAGGEGVRFEIVGCRTPTGADRRGDDFSRAIYELEAFSRMPLVGVYTESDASREALAAWERFKSAMLLGGFDDSSLKHQYEKSPDTGRDHPGWETLSDAIGRVDDAIVRYMKAEPNAWNRQSPTQRDDPERAFERQLRRLQATRQVMVEECDTQSHVSLV